MVSRLVLGTAQFGMDYGINNKRGMIPDNETFRILKKAIDSGISTFDTACAYVNSEIILGKFIESSNADLKIISKLSACAHSQVKEIFEQSLRYLKIDKIYGYLIHNFASYKKDIKIWDELIKLRDSARIGKIGFSLYYPEELGNLLKNNVDLNIIQVPFNIFDRRFEPYFEELKNKKIEVHIRSVFLQGLVFKKPVELTGKLKKIRERNKQLNMLSGGTGISVAGLCLGFVLENKLIDKIVVGVDSLANFEELIGIAESDYLAADILNTLCAFKIDDEDIILPFNWNLARTGR